MSTFRDQLRDLAGLVLSDGGVANAVITVVRRSRGSYNQATGITPMVEVSRTENVRAIRERSFIRAGGSDRGITQTRALRYVIERAALPGELDENTQIIDPDAMGGLAAGTPQNAAKVEPAMGGMVRHVYVLEVGG